MIRCLDGFHWRWNGPPSSQARLFGRPKLQIYSKSAYHRRTTSNSTKKRIEEYRGLTKTFPLAHESLYIHTAHNDEMYYHSLDFSKGNTKRNCVCVVFVFRWLSVPTFFVETRMTKDAIVSWQLTGTLLSQRTAEIREYYRGKQWDTLTSRAIILSHR